MCEAMDPAEVLEAAEIARHRVINETIARGESRVQQFYAGVVVLVTGGSGFLGKQLIEKLLRSTNIEKMFVLMRQKKNKTIEQRLKQLFEEPVYENLRKTQPNFTEKIVPVMADLAEINVGIREEDWERITQEVTVIFHGAATISFTEPLRLATLTNVRGTMEMMKLARACKNLKSYVHISTAYSHATHQNINQVVLEKFYKSPISPEVLVQLVLEFGDEKLDALTLPLIENWPNTYSFTKAVAEEAVRIMAGDLPICIVRPAIVISAICEPSPGWIDGSCAFGPSGYVIGSAIGIIHTFQSSDDYRIDIVPVDIVNNAIIAAAHATVERRESGQRDILIYNVTNSRDRIPIDALINEIFLAVSKMATPKAIWFGYLWRTNNKFMYVLLSWLLHYIPGYLVDGILKVIGKKPMLTKVYNTVDKLNGVFTYYMSNDWSFDDSNLRKLFWDLSPADRIIYNCNMIPMNWGHYVAVWFLGCRKYIIKDGLKNTASGLRKRFYFRFLNGFVFIMYGFMFFSVLKYLSKYIILGLRYSFK